MRLVILKAKQAFLQYIFSFLLLGLFIPVCALAVEISDTPLEIQINAPPPALVFILDDSGSMDSEFLTPEPNGRMGDCYYLFPDEAYSPAADHTFGHGIALDADQRRIWRSQWHSYNRLYFDPAKVYLPWPATSANAFQAADLHRPLSNPVNRAFNSPRCRMAAIFLTLSDRNGDQITIPMAHYFTSLDTPTDAGAAVYLVTWQDGNEDGFIDLGRSSGLDLRRYFQLQDDGDGVVEDNELVPVSDGSIIASLRPEIVDAQGRFLRYQTDDEALQNFVNWFGYYRRREFVLKSVVAGTLTGMNRVQVGFYALNSGPRLAVQPVKIPPEPGGDPIKDRTEFLLDALYAMESRGSTPLRTALDQVGRYFHQGRTSALGASPFWEESYGGGCQRAYAVVMTDGYWNDAFSGVGNADGDQGAPFADHWSDTLADIAFYYYANDLAPELPDAMPPMGCDQAPHQHLTTHTLALGVNGTIDPRDINGDGNPDHPGYFDDPCFKDSRTPRPLWPMPLADRPTAVDDLWHTAINGRGLYFNAGQPDALAQALAGIVAQFEGAEFSAASVEIKGAVLPDETVVYQTSYRPGVWTGDLKALRYDPAVDQGEFAPADILWSAAERIEGPGVTAEDRRIVTYGGIWHRPRGVAFRYDELSTGQKSALGSDLVNNSIRDKTARMLVDYLRGREIAPFRSRESILGDMVHAAPVLVDDTVFVGANDGMLHAFDARTGQERFAYIPGPVFGQLKNLAQSDYEFRHHFYVDATPSVGEVLVGQYRRRRYLVGGLGKGGKGYFCLRIAEQRRTRSAEEFSPYETLFSVDDFGPGTLEDEIAGIVQWEYPRPDSGSDDMDNDGDTVVDETGEEDPDVGYSFGQGYAVNANTGESEYRPVVIFSNGYNSPNGRAVLFIVDADSGTLLRKIDTGAGEDNGLSIPALIDVDLDRRIDYAYAGDLKGNLWKFDLTSDSISLWGVAYGKDTNGNGRIDAADGDLPQPLFRAVDQPITGRPDIMRARSICAADTPGYVVIFGTGKCLGAADLQDTGRQSIYALWDYGDDGDDSEYLGYISNRDQGRLSKGLRLIPRKVTRSTTNDGSPTRVLSNTEVDFSVVTDSGDGDGLMINNVGNPAPDPLAEAGWFFDFPAAPDPDADPGERVIGDVVIRGGNALVTSFAPDTAPCASGGISWIYLLSGCSGTTSESESDNRVLITPMTAKRYDGRLNINPAVFKEASEMSLDHLLLSDDSGRIFKEAFQGERWGKVYWRENID